MKAIGYSAFGTAQEVLRLLDVLTPTPGNGQVLVRLRRSGVNPSDIKARAGARPGITKPPYATIIPHSDGSGIIEAVGTGVDRARIGQRVWVWNGQWKRAHGTAAEYIAINASQAVPMPDNMSFDIGATMGIPVMTAAHCVFGGNKIVDQTLLISGGAGAVGHNAVQLAKWGGAKVIATAAPDGFDRVKEAGADVVFDYNSTDLISQINDFTNGTGVDRAIEVEFGHNAEMLGQVMKENATIAAYGSAFDMAPSFGFGSYLFRAITLDIVLIYILPRQLRQHAMDQAQAAFDDGQLRPTIHAQFTLADAAAAHDAVAAGKRSGAVLLRMDGP